MTSTRTIQYISWVTVAELVRVPEERCFWVVQVWRKMVTSIILISARLLLSAIFVAAMYEISELGPRSASRSPYVMVRQT